MIQKYEIFILKLEIKRYVDYMYVHEFRKIDCKSEMFLMTIYFMNKRFLINKKKYKNSLDK